MPYYPDFAPLTMAMHDEYQGRVQIFPCYTEFSFADLFAWNTNGMTKVSLLNGNIVVIRPDYITHTPILTFIGTNKLESTIDRLLNDAPSFGIEPVLQNIPKELVDSLDCARYTISKDDRHDDYILDCEAHSKLEGGKYASMRSKINKYVNTYGQDTEISIMPHTQDTFDQIMQLFDRWQISSRKSIEDTSHERMALIKILNNISLFRSRITAIHINRALAGITINSPQNDMYEMGMFLKFDYSYTRLFEYLVYATAQHACSEGNRYINFQQDLGIPSLRNAKMELHPSHLFNKFTIGFTHETVRESKHETMPVHNILAQRENLSRA